MEGTGQSRTRRALSRGPAPRPTRSRSTSPACAGSARASHAAARSRNPAVSAPAPASGCGAKATVVAPEVEEQPPERRVVGDAAEQRLRRLGEAPPGGPPGALLREAPAETLVPRDQAVERTRGRRRDRARAAGQVAGLAREARLRLRLVQRLGARPGHVDAAAELVEAERDLPDALGLGRGAGVAPEVEDWLVGIEQTGAEVLATRISATRAGSPPSASRSLFGTQVVKPRSAVADGATIWGGSSRSSQRRASASSGAIRAPLAAAATSAWNSRPGEGGQSPAP